MMRVGERPPARDDLLEQVNRAVIVLEVEPLASLRHEVLRTDVHVSPGTSARSAGCPPRSRPWAGSPAGARRGAGRPPSTARRPADRDVARSAPPAPGFARPARSAGPPAPAHPAHRCPLRQPPPAPPLA